MPSSATKKTLEEWGADMRGRWKMLMATILGTAAGMLIGFNAPDKQHEYAIVEDNGVETIISIKQGDDLTLLNVNRHEDGGGLWEVTYDGKGEPKTRRVE